MANLFEAIEAVFPPVLLICETNVHLRLLMPYAQFGVDRVRFDKVDVTVMKAGRYTLRVYHDGEVSYWY